ncbi:MAG: hypothetical protein Q7K43_04010 [Candidatus Woesearchaeota archaeon]|nr:hypothetical protein [Candidatus Woesearchaeota archaeon]
MPSIFTRKDVQKALADAKRLIAEPEPPKGQAELVYQDGIAQAEKLKHLLKPSWFIRDIDAEKKESTPNSKQKNKPKKRRPVRTTTHSRRSSSKNI